MAQFDLMQEIQARQTYFALLTQLHQQESAAVAPRPLHPKLHFTPQMVILQLLHNDEQVYSELRFWNDEFLDAYCEQPLRQTLIAAMRPAPASDNIPPLPPAVQHALNIATEITQAGAYCGYPVPEITISDQTIHIKQVDYTNAKSSDYRDHYSMWRLHCTIYLHKMPARNTLDTYIGNNMEVSFSDHSKPQSSCRQTVESLIQQWAKAER